MKLKVYISYAILTAVLLLAPQVGAQNVQVTLTPANPPVQIPASGGSFIFTINLTIPGSSPETFAIWSMITLPNGNPYGPVLGPSYFTLPAGANVNRVRTQAVPDVAPTGAYTYFTYVGIYPNTIWDSDNFPFQKMAAGSNELWVARFNGPGNSVDSPKDIGVDGEGNFYVTGTSTGIGTAWDYSTIKYDLSGVQLWETRYNSPANNSDDATALVVDAAGNVYVTGTSIGVGTQFDYVTIKYNSTGVEQWLARYDGPIHNDEFATGIAVDSFGNVFVTGFSAGDSTFFDYATVKYNPSGVEQWVARYNGPANSSDIPNAIIVDGSSNTIVVGESVGPGFDFDFATVKYDANGNLLWVSRYNGEGNGNDIARGVIQDGSSNTIVVGESVGSGSATDFATVKYDPSGNLLWVSRYNGPGNGADVARGVIVDGTSNTIVIGESTGNGSLTDITTVKYDPYGVLLWVSRYNGPGNNADFANDVILDGTSNTIVVGESVGNGTGSDFTTIKYDSYGVVQWVERYNGPANNYDAVKAITRDGSGDICVTGKSTGVGSLTDYATVKYSGGNVTNWQPVEVIEFGAPLPHQCSLEPPSPNPFNPTTAISYQLSANSIVSIKVYDTAGRLVAALVDGWREAGAHEVTFDGSGLAAGVYFVRMQAGDFSAVQKMVLIK
jgi:hypothetical protein